jgi:hypothetical protein
MVPIMAASVAAASSSIVPAGNHTSATVMTAPAATTSPFPRLSSQAKRSKGLQALASAVVQKPVNRKRKAPEE